MKRPAFRSGRPAAFLYPTTVLGSTVVHDRPQAMEPVSTCSVAAPGTPPHTRYTVIPSPAPRSAAAPKTRPNALQPTSPREIAIDFNVLAALNHSISLTILAPC